MLCILLVDALSSKCTNTTRLEDDGRAGGNRHRQSNLEERAKRLARITFHALGKVKDVLKKHLLFCQALHILAVRHATRSGACWTKDARHARSAAHHTRTDLWPFISASKHASSKWPVVCSFNKSMCLARKSRLSEFVLSLPYISMSPPYDLMNCS